jgi:hypothetical protein
MFEKKLFQVEKNGLSSKSDRTFYPYQKREKYEKGSKNIGLKTPLEGLG